MIATARRLLSALLVSGVSVGAAGALAQDDRYATTTSSVPGFTAPQAVPAWSGEPGGSGHPLMQPSAILAAAADFKNCLERFWPEAGRRGVSRASFERFTAGLEPDLRIMDLLDAQPEFTKSFWDYLDILVKEERILRGQEMLAQHRATFDAVERAYGVDRHVLAAIWGVETNYSTQMGERPVIRSVATLACVGRRQKYFRDEFLSALEILHRGDLTPEQLRGSWAGAFGPTQFMPTTFKRFAVDFDGDGRRDLVRSVPDILASTANFLKGHGWQRGGSWEPGSANYGVIRDWNRAEVYQRTISVMATRLKSGG